MIGNRHNIVRGGPESQQPNQMQNRPHILFAEDDPDTREIVKMLLRSEGFEVSVTATGLEALQCISANHFDALLLDNWMPDLTGIEVCRKIRAFDQSTPIFLYSGAATDADRKAAASAGAQGFFEKPMDLDPLLVTLKSICHANSNW